MIKITHKPRFPSLRQMSVPWFERSFLPFSKTLYPWFRDDLWDEMERTWGDYLDNVERAFVDLPRLERKFTIAVTCDLDDRADRFVLTADLPGMEEDEVEINVLDSEIEISAKHKESKEEKKEGHIKRERSQVRYYRTLTLPEEIVGTKVTAKMTNGTLSVELPKKTPAKVEKPIPIKVQ